MPKSRSYEISVALLHSHTTQGCLKLKITLMPYRRLLDWRDSKLKCMAIFGVISFHAISHG